jgi:hypothetical protein
MIQPEPKTLSDAEIFSNIDSMSIEFGKRKVFSGVGYFYDSKNRTIFTGTVIDSFGTVITTAHSFHYLFNSDDAKLPSILNFNEIPPIKLEQSADSKELSRSKTTSSPDDFHLEKIDVATYDLSNISMDFSNSYMYYPGIYKATKIFISKNYIEAYLAYEKIPNQNNINIMRHFDYAFVILNIPLLTLLRFHYSIYLMPYYQHLVIFQKVVILLDMDNGLIR